jgi:tetratricopeptide (TPR) repeat protein
MKIIAYVLFLLLSVDAFIAEAQRSESKSISANKQFEFATLLFNNAEYHSSIVEFERFLFLFPDDQRKIQAMYQIGLAFQKQKKFLLAIDRYQKILMQPSMNETFLQAGFRLSECYQSQNNYQMALSTLQILDRQKLDQDDRDFVNYQMGWLFIKMKQFVSAENCLYKIKKQSAYPIDEILFGIKERKSLDRKNPYMAGVLSIIPGLGQIYCERYRDASLSLIVNGIIGWAAWESFDNEQPALGSLITFFGIGFYSGNIYGAANSAHKHNRRIRKRWLNHLEMQYHDIQSYKNEHKNF